jgi:hypothetical protein
MHAPNSNEGYFKKILQFGSSIKVSIVQASGHITICVPPHNHKLINCSTNDLKTLKCMHPIQMMDTLQKF